MRLARRLRCCKNKRQVLRHSLESIKLATREPDDYCINEIIEFKDQLDDLGKRYTKSTCAEFF